MSRFYSALDLVLGELDRRREAGYEDWRASAAAVARLLSAEPAPAGAPAATMPAMAQPPAPAQIIAPSADVPKPVPAPAADLSADPVEAPSTRTLAEALPAMPAPDEDNSLSLFGDELPVAKPASGSGKKSAALAASKPGTYEPVTDPAESKAERLAKLRACPRRLPCQECPYGTGQHNHIVFGVGNLDAEVVFVGEAPGADEDKQGEPFVGKAGQLLNKIIATMGFQRSDIYLANVLKCRPDTPGQDYGNRKPTATEMTSCRPCLFEQIDIIQPKAIVALGATAMQGLLDNVEPMRDLRGRWHDYKGIPVMATYHPSYLLRNQLPSEKRKVWEDLLLVKEKLGHEITEKDRSYFLTKG